MDREAAERHAAMLKRQAFQIAGQLPEDVEDARRVLQYVLELVEWEASGLQPKLAVVK